MEIVQIRDVEHLENLASVGQGVQTFIRLNGDIHSTKFISITGGRFYILHEIDGFEQRLLPKNIRRAGMLQDAIDTGNFFAELF